MVMSKFFELSFHDVALLRASLGSYYKLSIDTFSYCNHSMIENDSIYQDIKNMAFRHAVDAKTMLLRLENFEKVV